MKYYFLLVALIVLWFSSFRLEKKSAGNRPANNVNNITCTLSSDKHAFMMGEGPDFNVSITNLGNQDIYLIGALDGSNDRSRMPYCYFTVEHPRADTFLATGRHCSITGSLDVKDFILVKKGGSFNPYRKIDGARFTDPNELQRKENFKYPGKYKVRFHYSTMSNDINKFKGFGDPKPELAQMLSKVPKLELLSNEIEIVVAK